MAPSFCFEITPVASFTYTVNSTTPRSPVVKRETKKEKERRLARERMLSSWSLFNKKTEKIIKIVQTCKPRHRAYVGR